MLSGERRRVPVWVVLGGVLIAIGAGPSTALADECDDSSAVDQYQECIPSSGGSTPTDNANDNNGGAGGSNGSGALDPEVSGAIASEGGADATLLEEVATSPSYGAPKAKPKRDRETGLPMPTNKRPADVPTGAANGGADPSKAFSAAASAVTGGDQTRLLGILAAAVAISAAAFGAVALRQRRS
jgi:hypothetical protein